MWCLDREGALLQVLPIMLKLCCLLLRVLCWGYWHGQSFPHQFGDILTAALLATGHALAVVRSLVGVRIPACKLLKFTKLICGEQRIVPPL